MQRLSAYQLAMLASKAARMGLTLNQLLERIEDEARERDEWYRLQHDNQLQREVLSRKAVANGRWIEWRAA